MNTRVTEAEYKEVKQTINQYMIRNRRVVTFAELADHCQAPLGTVIKAVYDSAYKERVIEGTGSIDNNRRR